MSACCVWDFRISLLDENGKSLYLDYDSGDEGEEPVLDYQQQSDELRNWLTTYTKKWAFQLEAGEQNGYLHFQGRFSLKEKDRKNPLMKLFEQNELPVPNYLEPTSKEIAKSKDMWYVLKEKTRIAGPWTDKDEELFIPVQFKSFVDDLYPYQDHILNYNQFSIDDQSNRNIMYGSTINYFRDINYLYDPDGNAGKSVVSSLCELKGRGVDVPPILDAKEVIQIICDICMSRNERSPSPIIFDLPRTIDQKKLISIYTAIEQVKKGKLYDPRHNYKSWWINTPDVWIFSNQAPDLATLSADRWRVWVIDKDTKTLKKFEPFHNDVEMF